MPPSRKIRPAWERLTSLRKDAIAKLATPRKWIRGSVWARKYRRIDSLSANPGPFRADVAPYQLEPIDSCCDPGIQEVSLMWCAQSGKTAGVFGSVIGFFMHWIPRSIIVMLPNLDDARDWSRQKLETMIDESPALREVVAAPRSRDKEGSILRKSFAGGILMAVGSNSSRALRGRSAPILIEDECDAFERTPEGEPSDLLWRRARTFPDKKRIRSSTPTLKGTSRIERAFLRSDQRYYYVPCPHCGLFFRLEWGLIKWDKDSETGEHLPETARVECPFCDGKIYDRHKRRMLRWGRWVPHAPEVTNHRGYHLNALYPLWVKFSEVVQNFLEAKEKSDLQTWVNTDLAETWADQADERDPEVLYSRRENYTLIPRDVLLLLAAVDVQDDRLEYEIKGLGKNDETWGVEVGQLWGDPSNLTESGPWALLDEVINREREHELGVFLRVVAYGVDTRGHHTTAVYRYCKAREHRRCYALAGVTGEGAALVRRPTTNNAEKVPLYPVSANTAKETVFRRLAVEEPGPGYCHFPTSYDLENFEQLCAEKRRAWWYRGVQKVEWVKTRRRNELLDIRGYLEATQAILNPDFRALEKRLAARVEAALPGGHDEAVEGGEEGGGRTRRPPPSASRKSFAKDY